MGETEHRALANQVVMPLVTPEQAKAQWKTYEAVKAAILDESDYQIIRGKKFPKKSAFRKLAVFFGLNDEIIEKERVDRDDSTFTWGYTVRATAPNGRYTTGVGLCDSREKQFAHVEHDVKSTAHTRAKNRAISDMVAGGEVSAEEVEAEDTTIRKKVDAEAKPTASPQGPIKYEVPDKKPKAVDPEVERVSLTLEANDLNEDVDFRHIGNVIRVLPGSGFPRDSKAAYDHVLVELMKGKWLSEENRWEVPVG